jgi:hypothetical protein
MKNAQIVTPARVTRIRDVLTANSHENRHQSISQTGYFLEGSRSAEDSV